MHNRGDFGTPRTIPAGPHSTRPPVSDQTVDSNLPSIRFHHIQDRHRWKIQPLDMLLRHGHPSMSFRVLFRDTVPQGTLEKLCINLIALTPREYVVGFTGGLSAHAMRDLVITVPNIEDLNLTRPVVSDTFLQPDPPSRTKLLPSLRRLCLSFFTLQYDDDWSSLTNYLIHQTLGGKSISLRLCREHPPIPPEIASKIEDLVEEFNLGYPNT